MAITSAIVGVASAGLTAYSAYSQAEASKKEAEFNAAQMERNARIAEVQAGDAVSRGDQQAQVARTKTSQTIGSQRAGLAAQGIDPDSGSAANIQQDTQTLGERDVMTIKNNAWREAWGYKVEAQNQKGTAAMTREAGDNKYKNTLLTGGIQALNIGVKTYSDYKNSTKG